MNGVRYTKPVRAVDDIKYLTVEEQEKPIIKIKSMNPLFVIIFFI